MAAESFTITAKPEQNADAIFAFAKSLIARRLANGVLRLDKDRIQVIMYPETAARYKDPNTYYGEDREATLGAIAAAGYAVDGPEAPPEEPVEEEPATPPAPEPVSE